MEYYQHNIFSLYLKTCFSFSFILSFPCLVNFSVFCGPCAVKIPSQVLSPQTLIFFISVSFKGDHHCKPESNVLFGGRKGCFATQPLVPRPALRPIRHGGRQVGPTLTHKRAPFWMLTFIFLPLSPEASVFIIGRGCSPFSQREGGGRPPSQGIKHLSPSLPAACAASNAAYEGQFPFFDATCGRAWPRRG